ncbi:hypothetical protein Mapa_015102 [Marchantia paleacea]|nr:hypothetical protein Mapa_015102 [Marchantia paleacea]
MASHSVSSASFTHTAPALMLTTLRKRLLPLGRFSVMFIRVSPIFVAFFFHPSDASWKNMASRSLASDSAFTSSNLVSSFWPAMYLLLTGGRPTCCRNALNFGCSTHEKDTVPHDSYSHSASVFRAASVWALLGPVPRGALIPGLFSFLTLSSSKARAPRSSFPPESRSGAAALRTISALLARVAGAASIARSGAGRVVGDGALLFRTLVVVAEGFAAPPPPLVGEILEIGFGMIPLKFGHVPRFKCSDAVRDGLEAENIALHKLQRSFTALGVPDSGF